MQDFQKNLCNFLNECKQDALLELKENKAYSSWQAKAAELQADLRTRIPEDCLNTFSEYIEALTAISGIETDYCYLCAIRDYLRIAKQFEKPLDGEWGDLVSHMIHSTDNS